MPQSLAEQLAGTPLFGANAAYLEALYEQYLTQPVSIDSTWRSYFDALPATGRPEQPRASILAALAASARRGASARAAPLAAAAGEKQAAVARLIQTFSNRGHLIAHIDPLGLLERPRPRVLDLDYHGLSEADLDTEFFTASRDDWIPRRA